MTLAYDGTEFAGWQYQPDQRTVQGVVEQALQRVTGQWTRVVASGRTDAGVHARGQVASFRVPTQLTPTTLCRALNATTPADVLVCEVSQVAAGFHAIRDALSKRYCYTLQDGPPHDLFTRRFTWQLARRLDEDRMRDAASYLRGRHDFSSFEAAGAPRASSVRTVTELSVCRQPGPFSQPLMIEVEADGFLYNMVRNIVGSLVLVGAGRQPPEWVLEVLAGKDRRRAGPTAPPHGLTLMQVRYGAEQGGTSDL